MNNEMKTAEQIRNKIFAVTAETFAETAMEVFKYQFEYNTLYHNYCTLLKKDPHNVTDITGIPFLPVQFFKTHKIQTGNFDESLFFESSGTSGSVNSRHFVKNIAVYEESFLNAFELQYGNLENLCIIGLLPSYLERKHSSLVYMVDHFINISTNRNSGFYLYDHEKLKSVLLENEKEAHQTILIGVTYALLDFAENNPMHLQHTTVMETGGMKGRREELSRMKVHEILIKQLGIQTVHSEYGMTELLSQAYSKKEGIFQSPPWMKILLRNENDPFEIVSSPAAGRSSAGGAVNIIDLANIYSCAFIATDDAGKIYEDGSFEIMGRLDNSDVRGCGLMIV
jgi:hypothetical protein